MRSMRNRGAFLPCAVLSSVLFALSSGWGDTVRLGPEERTGQVYLEEGEPGTVFDATGLVIRSGRSKHFSPPPRFLLYSAAKHDPESGAGYPSTEELEAMELPNEEIYPMQLRDLDSPSLRGATVIGQQSRELPWRVVKSMWDGDALHVKGCRGRVVVSDVYWENVEDGLGPLEGLESWSLRDSCLRYIRDDAIESDDLIPGEVVNCLIDGCFTFLSQRSEPPRRAEITTTIRDCLIHVQSQPHDGIPGKQWRDRNIRMGDDGIGRAPGMLFKWGRGAGEVEMTNCLVKIDAVSVNGDGDMEFPPGRYDNVTLIWLGEGRYPRPLPEGVTLRRDASLWEEARSEWIAKLPAEHPIRRALNE